MGWFKDIFTSEEELKEPKHKSKKKESLLDDDLDEDKDFMGQYKDNEEEWMQIEITVMTPYSELIKLKNALKPYAEELDWEMESGNNTFVEDNTKVGGGKIKRVNVTLRPKGGSISPIEFLNHKDKIVGLVFSIHRDMLHSGKHDKAIKDFRKTININYTRQEGHEPNKNDYTMSESLSFLSYSYKLIDRIKFEKRNKEAAKELFGSTAEEDIRSIFKPEKAKLEKKEDKPKGTNNVKDKELMKQLEELEHGNKKFKQEIEESFGWKL